MIPYTFPHKIITLFTLLFCFSLAGQIQVSVQNASNPTRDLLNISPNASTLGTFGNIPTGNFTGIPSIGIPLYNVAYKSLNLPVSLMYHNAVGNKPDVIPGSVGLGWLLNAGGSITRVENNNFYDPNQAGELTFNPTSEPDWDSDLKLSGHLNREILLTDINNPIKRDFFSFSFNGLSGDIYMDHNSKFKIRCNEGVHFDIEVELFQPNSNKRFMLPSLENLQAPPYYPYPYYVGPYTNYVTINSISFLYKMTLTDTNGVKYIFGGTDESIEFSRVGHAIAYDELTIAPKAVVWNLTAIKAPNGDEITLEYKRGQVITSSKRYSKIQQGVWEFTANGKKVYQAINKNETLNGEYGFLVNPSYLTKISTPIETITFNNTVTNQLSYGPSRFDREMFEYGNVNYHWNLDIANARVKNFFPEKLVDITVKDKKGDLYKKIDFAYLENNTRLKLSEVLISGQSLLAEKQSYKFEYNPTPLPDYNSYKTDHYGYYNGSNTYIPNLTASDYGILLNFKNNSSEQQNYYNSREPNFAYSTAEILTKIIYPTKGYTKFEYEQNDYGTVAKKWPFENIINTGNQNLITGGLRIKKIANFDYNNQKLTSKEFYYLKDYQKNGTLSSGVCSHKPTYFDVIKGTATSVIRTGTTSWYAPDYNNLDYFHFSTEDIFPMGRLDGSPITYSEVTELSEDGSYIVYKYKNHDNGFQDKPLVNYKTDHPDTFVDENGTKKRFWTNTDIISMNLERGQILSETYYTPGKSVSKKSVKEIIYEYNDDNNRFNDNIRVLKRYANPVYDLTSGNIRSMCYTAGLIYTYFPYLKKTTVTESFANNNVITTTNFKYDNNYRYVREIEKLAGENIIKQINRYPGDFAVSASDVYSNMIESHITGVIIESETKKNDTRITLSHTDFIKNPSNQNQFVPKYQFTQFREGALEKKMSYDQYDEKGNILQYTLESGTPVCIVWGYNKTRPIAKIENASYSQVSPYVNNLQTISDTGTELNLLDALKTLRNAPVFSAAIVSTYTYIPMVGLSSVTDTKGFTTTYKYDNFGRLQFVKDSEGNILSENEYHYKK